MEEKQKTAGELRREALLYQPKNGYDRLSAQDEADMKSYCEDYKKFLDAGKTERECVTEGCAWRRLRASSPLPAAWRSILATSCTGSTGARP